MSELPSVIGRYEIVSRLGQGGMGSLFLAKDPKIGRLVAIKLVRADFDSTEARQRFAREAQSAGTLRHPNIVTIFDVDDFDGLLVEYASRTGASLILRGLRAVSDFEYELQMAMMNRRLAPELETAFLMPNEAFSYVSSRLVREVARLGGDVGGLVPPAVVAALQAKYANP